MPLQRFLERLILVCMTPLVLLTTWLAVKDVFELDRRSAASAAAAMDHVIQHVDEDMRAHVRGLQVLAASPSLDPPGQYDGFYREAQAYRDAYGSQVVLVSPSVQMLLNTRVAYGAPLPPLPPFTCRSAELSMLTTGRPAFCEQVFGPLAQKKQVIAAVPVVRQGQATHFVATGIEHATFQRLLDRMDLPPGWSLSLLDSQNQAVAGRAPDSPSLGSLDSLGRRWSARSAVAGWSVVMEVGPVTYYGPIASGAAILLLGLLGSTLVALYGVRRAGRQLAGAVSSLSGPAGTPRGAEAGTPPVDLDEIATARRTLGELTAARDRAQAEKLEHEQVGKAKLASALAAMTDAVFITDSQGQLTEFNEAFMALHRVGSREECRDTMAEHSARTDVFLPTGEPVPLAQWPASRALRGESAVNVELTLRCRSSNEAWTVSYSFAPIRGHDGVIVGSVTSGRDMTEIKTVREALLQSQRELRQLVAKMNKVEDKERQRIARELHDELQQSLGVIRLDLVAIGRQCAADAPGAATLAGQTVELVDAAIVSVRRIVNDLRPYLLDELGLAAAMESMVRNFGKHHGVSVTMDIMGLDETTGVASEPEAELANAVYRIAQESLNNVHKHAKASFLYVLLDLSSPERVELLINDDGQGMRPADPAKGRSFGLRGMRERARALGGTVELTSDPERGTTVQALFPRQR